jgi:hypothetical protein
VICRSCGTEIADKALICYRCGTATTEAKFKPVPIKRGSGPNIILTVIALVLLVLIALYMGRAAAGEIPRYVSWTGAGIAAVVLLVRLVAKRR